jgi:hypothetical protein
MKKLWLALSLVILAIPALAQSHNDDSEKAAAFPRPSRSQVRHALTPGAIRALESGSGEELWFEEALPTYGCNSFSQCTLKNGCSFTPYNSCVVDKDATPDYYGSLKPCRGGNC